MNKVPEFKCFRINGFAVLAANIAVFLAGLWWLVNGIIDQDPTRWIGGGLLLLVAGVLAPGFFTVQPNQARVLVFFGRYTGSCHHTGFNWANPFAIKKKVSLRVRNFNSVKIKVNDASGSPIEIAAVVVWNVVDSAKALFDVDDYGEFVDVQAETAIRALATRYPYDPPEEGKTSLRENPDAIAEEMRLEVQRRLEVAGVEVLEARLTHLAYATEIAQAMLRRQQAQAVIAARRLIVEAAVGMVQHALDDRCKHNIVNLDEERKAAMVNNMMVVLTSEHGAAPVVNVGSLYA
jgi:regulator of protease activity HflC (stomatin/prohibitin superfamily)